MAGKTPWRIRRFRATDIEAIIEIEANAFPKSAYSKEILLMYSHRLSEGFFVIEIEKGIGGYILFDQDGHIYSMAVKSSQRRKGFGRLLFMHAADRVKNMLWLEVRSKNQAAIEFYQEMGMRVIGKLADYYERDDALVMVLERKEQLLEGNPFEARRSS